ncbi:MAG: phosphopyruvate hydratase [Candidatus Levybacteria bacterium]|nr:phosphopyruvate hydratase [Candidatus Levybacteria bacterium]
MKISHIHARQILDSRGFPTVETDVTLEDGSQGRAAVPSGSSTGTHEALELRDNDPGQYQGKSVHQAVNNVNTTIAQEIIGKNLANQKELDERMTELDGTENKSHLGANAILSVSLAAAKAEAISQHIPLYQYFGSMVGNSKFSLPLPMMNIINGGKHASGSTDIQEFMILPIGAGNFSQALEMGSNVFHVLGKILLEKNYATTVGDEGGYAPHVKGGNKEALDLISHAIQKSGYDLGKDIVLGLDVAASELVENNNYVLKTENKSLDTDSFIGWLLEMTKDYPLVSIEDGLAEDDFEGWKKLTHLTGNGTQLVGDDLFVTDPKRIEKGIAEKEANAVLIKLNQIGTLTETIKAVQTAQKAGWKAIISHRSGETEDTTISHLAVGLNTGQIKTGSLSRSERMAKYNELLRIEEQLGDNAVFTGRNALL